MSKIQVYDPAMCCSTGVCGPGIDPALPRIAADLEWLKSKGVEIERYNLAQDIAAFTSNSTVKQALNSQGTKSLPMTLVNGEVMWHGEYPTREQLASVTGVAYEPGPAFKPHDPDLVSIGRPSTGAKR